MIREGTSRTALCGSLCSAWVLAWRLVARCGLAGQPIVLADSRCGSKISGSSCTPKRWSLPLSTINLLPRLLPSSSIPLSNLHQGNLLHPSPPPTFTTTTQLNTLQVRYPRPRRYRHPLQLHLLAPLPSVCTPSVCKFHLPPPQHQGATTTRLTVARTIHNNRPLSTVANGNSIQTVNMREILHIQTGQCVSSRWTLSRASEPRY